jgi:NADPH:quinone reductase-like Zn-dependent oxidoreductase
MKAIVQYEYGSPDILQLAEVDKPTPKEHEVLIKVCAASVNGSDWEGLRGKPLYARFGGLRRPGNKILGSDIAGRVELVGAGVTEFQPGDDVFGEMEAYRGSFAEYACTSERALARKPAGMSFEQAAAIPQGAVIALQGLRDKGQVQPGQRVLINGAGGSAGMFAVQLANYYGAEVTGVDNSGKMDFVRSLGADHVVDYTREDFTKNGQAYDLILDVIALRSVFACRRALKPNGSYYAVGGSTAILLQILFLGAWIKRTSGKNIGVLAVQRNRKDLLYMAELCEAGKIVPVIDRLYPLHEAAEALRYVGEGRAKGKVVITVGS